MNQAAPSRQAPISGVTWGRPSARTVVSQYSSASTSTFSVSGHGVAAAAGWLNRSSNLSCGM